MFNQIENGEIFQALSSSNFEKSEKDCNFDNSIKLYDDSSNLNYLKDDEKGYSSTISDSPINNLIQNEIAFKNTYPGRNGTLHSINNFNTKTLETEKLEKCTYADTNEDTQALHSMINNSEIENINKKFQGLLQDQTSLSSNQKETFNDLNNHYENLDRHYLEKHPVDTASTNHYKKKVNKKQTSISCFSEIKLTKKEILIQQKKDKERKDIEAKVKKELQWKAKWDKREIMPRLYCNKNMLVYDDNTTYPQDIISKDISKDNYSEESYNDPIQSINIKLQSSQKKPDSNFMAHNIDSRLSHQESSKFSNCKINHKLCKKIPYDNGVLIENQNVSNILNKDQFKSKHYF